MVALAVTYPRWYTLVHRGVSVMVRVLSGSAAGTILCLGKFDALHRGHQALLQAAAELGPPSMLHLSGMAEVLGWEPRPPLVCPGERPAILGKWSEVLGKEICVLRIAFATVRTLCADDFLAFLHKDLQVGGVVVGEDFRFGHQRRGDVAQLQSWAEKHGLPVQVVPMLQEEVPGRGLIPISSSCIRRALEQGEVDLAAHLLGRAYRITGRIVRGDGRGRELGFPTANVADVANMLPANGVYAAQAVLADGTSWWAAVNIGYLPSIAQQRQLSVEAHLLDYSGGDIYDQAMRLDFHAHLRAERRFSSLEALRQQIAIDCQRVREFGNGTRP
ncbi:MAG: riboflavin biosynthesis protein RibF [Planctomycetota bacterium]|nr:MAG: riboflavin biosynthesis protein RibF [Planctomycetota bacterium]